MLIIDNQLDDLELVDSSEPICGECYQEKAVWKCHMCGSGPKPTYYCDQHRDSKKFPVKKTLQIILKNVFWEH